MDTNLRLAKLTEREKVCLRLWLQHKSAKEIAAELQITHHAVEKRLKIARMKLDATSSLEAARMLHKAEGYGVSVAQPLDLAPQQSHVHSKLDLKLIIGGVGMSLFAAAALVVAVQIPDHAAVPAPDRVLVREHDEQLNLHLNALVNSAEFGPDGDIILIRPFFDPRFLEPQSGYYWQISATGREDFTSRSLWDRTLKPSDQDTSHPIHYDSTQFPNEPLRMVEQTVVLPGSDVRWRFIVARPRGPR
jgi:DNA-binding CsgD family transcriptional regulator